MAVPPRRQRERRRQLVFADVQVQLSHSAMQEQIGNPQTETLNLVDETCITSGYACLRRHHMFN